MIYDCFCFFNELDLLDIRLHELAGVVDCFVLIEAAETFTGRPKSLVFWEAREKFEQFPICSLRLSHLSGETAWNREAYQRNAIADALQAIEANPGDIALIGDIDEIPTAEAVRNCKTPHSFTMAQAMYYANNQCSNFLWSGTQARTVADVLRETPEGVRVSRQWQAQGDIDGIHLSTMAGLDGAERVRQKLISFSHTECNQPQFLTDEHLQRAISERVDPCGNNAWQQWEISNKHIPGYLVEHYPYLMRS